VQNMLLMTYLQNSW